MAEVTTQVKSLLDQGWELYTAGEARPEHVAWTRRMQPPKEDSAPERSVDRQRTSQSFFGALPPDQQEGQTVPDRGEPEHRGLCKTPDLNLR